MKNKKEVKTLLFICCIIFLCGNIYQLTVGDVLTTSSSNDFRHYFPDSPDNTHGGVWTEVDKAIRDSNAWDLYEEIHCTIYQESVKVCGEHNPYCSNARGNNPTGSIDRGIVMYNSYWRGDVSDHVAYNPYLATMQMIKDFRAGKQKQWYEYCNKL